VEERHGEERAVERYFFSGDTLGGEPPPSVDGAALFRKEEEAM
jgi:hypothetical protein